MKKIRVGFVGAGWMGACQLRRLMERDDVEIAALCEKNVERGRQVLHELGLDAGLLVGDYEAVVSDSAIDAVWLVSPNSFHGPQAIAALERGKHVFCEKPAATSFAEWRREIELEQTHPGLRTFVDYILYFDAMATRLRGMIEAGEFGRITQIQVNYRHPINIAGDKTWKLSKAIMGDAIGMGIVHSLFMMHYLMAPQARPVGVFATSMPALVRGFEADPVWNILVRFDNGATGFCFGNIDNANGYDAYHNLFGTEGGFVFDSQLERTHKVRYWSERGTGRKWVYPLDPARCRAEDCEALAWSAETTTPDSGNVIEHQTGACVAHFIECIKTGRTSPLSFVNSAPIAEIGWAAQMSAATGKEVALPLDLAAAQAFFASKEN